MWFTKQKRKCKTRLAIVKTMEIFKGEKYRSKFVKNLCSMDMTKTEQIKKQLDLQQQKK